MFKNLFGKKNDGFYMQVDEAVSKDQAPTTPATPVAAKAPEPPVAAKVAEAVTVQEPSKDQPKDQAAEPAPKAKKTSIKDKKDKKDKTKDPEPAPTAAVAAVVEPAITNFATDYLIKPSSNSNRRKPGANMKQFMDMARQVETKKSPGQRAK
jgi:hypothetical protein